MIRSLLAILMLGLALASCSSSPGQEATGRQDQPPTLNAPDASTMVPIALRVMDAAGKVVIENHTDDWVPLGLQGVDGVPVTPPGKKNEIQIPAGADTLGWYCPAKLPRCGAPVPGQVGPAVVLGHVNLNGKAGVFNSLQHVKVDYQIEIDRRDGATLLFKVTRVSFPKKASFPTDEVYGDTPTSTLRLITCGGGDNSLITVPGAGRSYTNNTVVFADQVSQRLTHP